MQVQLRNHQSYYHGPSIGSRLVDLKDSIMGTVQNVIGDTVYFTQKFISDAQSNVVQFAVNSKQTFLSERVFPTKRINDCLIITSSKSRPCYKILHFFTIEGVNYIALRQKNKVSVDDIVFYHYQTIDGNFELVEPGWTFDYELVQHVYLNTVFDATQKVNRLK